MAGDLMKRVMEYSMRDVKRGLIEVLCFAFCGLAALGSLIFIAVGAYISLREFFVPWLCGLIVGGAILALAAVCCFALWLFTRRNPAPLRRPPQESAAERDRLDNAACLGEAIGRQLSRQGIRGWDVILAALAAGTVLGAGPVLRSRRRQSKGSSSGPCDHP